MEGSVITELLQNVGVPVLTAVGGWFASVWRNKQKKEADVLTNVTQILEMQKKYIAEQDAENKKTRDVNKRLEAKLDGKNKSIRKANWCKYTNEGDGCPVLNQEEKNDVDHYDKCETCKYHEDDNGEA